MSDKDKNGQQNGQTENQGQNQLKPQPEQVTLNQLLQGRDKNIETEITSSDNTFWHPTQWTGPHDT